MNGFVRLALPALSTLTLLGATASAYAQEDAAASPAAAPADAPAAAPANTPSNAPTDTPAAAPQERTSAFGIFFNPISLLFGFYGAELDFAPIRALSINVGGSYYSHSVTVLDTTVKTTAYELDAGAQIFFTGQRPMHGAYVFPKLAYAHAEATQTGYASAKAGLIGVGATVGYQWNWQPFSLRLGGGLMYYSVAAKAESGTPEISLVGTMPALDLTLGFVF